MINLAIVCIFNAGSHQLGERNIGGSVFYTQLKGIRQHIKLNIQTLLGQGFGKCRLVLGNRLRVCHIVRVAHFHVFSAFRIIDRHHKLAVQTI